MSVHSSKATSQTLAVKTCSMNSVVVYRDRAEVKRIAPITINKGESEVIITGLSEAIDGDSIRVETQRRTRAAIIDVVYNTREETTKVDNTESKNAYQGLLEQIKEKDTEYKHLEFRQKAIERQKELLDRYSKHVIEVHKAVVKDGSTIDNSFPSLVNQECVSTVMEFMRQYNTRLASLDERLQELQNNMKKVSEDKKVLVCKAEEIDPKKNISTCETIRSIKVVLETSEEECEVVLVLSYVVSNASWTPAYDVRVFTKDKTMKLHYYGMIKQSTDEDWDNANIALSTAQPDIGGSPPQLGIHHIGFLKPRAFAVRSVKKKGASFMPSIGMSRSSFVDEYDPTIEDCWEGSELESSYSGQERYRALSVNTKRTSRRRSPSPPSLEVEVAKVESGQLYNTTFKIPRTSTIPSDNTEHKVTVAIIELSPVFSYISVPKKSPLSFLQAKVKNNSAYAFLSGPANVFLDNNVLAKSALTDTSPGEEFTCSLGADQSVRISVQPVNIVRGTTGRMTKNNLLTYTHMYNVKNTQANTIKLKVTDQVPLSSDERLKVSMVDPDIKKQGVSVQFSHGTVAINDDNNIEWACVIPPNEEINLRLMFTVEFPPNDVVEGLQS